MSKFYLYMNYLRNLIFLIVKKCKYGNKIKFSIKEMIGKSSEITIKNQGMLSIGEKLYTRNNFNILIESGTCIIGNNCFFNHNCSITCIEEIKIGDKCTFGNNLVIVDHDHNFDDNVNKKFISSKVLIDEGCWIGANVTILRGSSIGKNCIIAAGSVVRGNIPDNSIYIQKRKSNIVRKK